MIKHQIKITVRQKGEKPISIAEFNKLTWIKKLALRWFGGVEKVMVIVPEKNVKTIEIKKEESDARFENAGQNKTI